MDLLSAKKKVNNYLMTGWQDLVPNYMKPILLSYHSYFKRAQHTKAPENRLVIPHMAELVISKQSRLVIHTMRVD